MAYETNDDLPRALDALSIFDVWERAYRDGALTEPPPAERRDGVYRSPFREDGKTGSFSVCFHGRGFKDFGGNGQKGRVWHFHELCYPNAQKKERASQLIEWSGITRTVAPTGPVAGAPGVDPRLVKAANRIDHRAKKAAQEDAIYGVFDKQLQQPEAKIAWDWPPCVKSSWDEGARVEDGGYLAKLAESRGWPASWAWYLWEQNLLSRPWERWATPGTQNAVRQKAFIIQAPRLERDLSIRLAPVGYHQRMFINGEKKWLYVPSIPQAEPRTDLERGIIEAAAARMDISTEVAKKERPTMVPPLPFVLGSTQRPKLIVLMEGQWDAFTFFAANGWAHDTAECPDVAVFGIRGAQGLEAFLGHWWMWLKRVKPRAWVIAQNDAAAKIWREAPPAQPGLPRPPSLSERLAAAGCVDPRVSWLKPGPWGKDFNDYFKARGGAAVVTPAKMAEWAKKAAVL